MFLIKCRDTMGCVVEGVIYLSICLSIYRSIYSPLLGLGRFLIFLILYTVGRTPWTWDQPVARPLPIQTQNKRTQTSVP
jgi:hypothetical protein